MYMSLTFLPSDYCISLSCPSLVIVVMNNDVILTSKSYKLVRLLLVCAERDSIACEGIDRSDFFVTHHLPYSWIDSTLIDHEHEIAIFSDVRPYGLIDASDSAHRRKHKKISCQGEDHSQIWRMQHWVEKLPSVKVFTLWYWISVSIHNSAVWLCVLKVSVPWYQPIIVLNLHSASSVIVHNSAERIAIRKRARLMILNLLRTTRRFDKSVKLYDSHKWRSEYLSFLIKLKFGIRVPH